jgi:sugar lactone lactonase YvrE
MTTSGTLTEFNAASCNCTGGGIAAGSDGALWLSGYNGAQIGRITTTGAITEFPVPGASLAAGISAGPDDALWFTQSPNIIGRMTTAGEVTQFQTPTAASMPTYVVAGPDGALWFTESSANQIGRITTSGVVTEYPLPGTSPPSGITAGPDNALWFTVPYPARVGKITLGGEVTEYKVPYGFDTYDGEIASGADGALWFLEQYALYRMTTTGVFTEFPLPSKTFSLGPIIAGPDGNLWFTVDPVAMVRAPACGLGFRASLSGSTLTMNFDLGIDTPASFDVEFLTSTKTVQSVPIPIPRVVPPHPFTLTRTNLPDVGEFTVVSSLMDSSGTTVCSEWTTSTTE